MYTNKLKEKLIKGEKMSTVCLISGHAPLIEIAAKGGFDAVLLEAEHSTLSQAECENLIRACEASNIVPLVRTRKNEPELILRYLDAGAMGILIPNVKNKEEAELAVKSIKYYPDGIRGLSTTRSADYGMSMSLKEYVRFANEQTLVFVMIESIEAVNNIEQIIEVSGLDGIIIGYTDLSLSLGCPGEMDNQLLKDAVERIIVAVSKSNLILGAPVGLGSHISDYFKKDYRIIFTGALGLYKKGVTDYVNATKFE